MWISLTSKLPTEFSPPMLSIFWAEPISSKALILRQFKEFCISSGILIALDYMDCKVFEEAMQLRCEENISSKEISLYTLLLYECGARSIYDIINSAVFLKGEKKKASLRVDGLIEEIKNLSKQYSENIALRVFRGLEDNVERRACIQYKGQAITVLSNEYTVLDDDKVKDRVFSLDSPYLHMETMERNSKIKKKDKLTDEQKLVFDSALLDGCDDEFAYKVAKGISFETTELPIDAWYKPRFELSTIFCKTEYEMFETINCNIIDDEYERYTILKGE